MSESHLKVPSAAASSNSSSLPTYSVRRMRNTAFLVKWIEDHQSNPYPTKAEKQYLAYYSGMNLTQLSTWFANARRRIKKIGMKTWLEGRSTFSLDYFPTAGASSISPLQRSSLDSYAGIQYPSYGSAYSPTVNTLHSSNIASHQQPTLNMLGSQMTNGLSPYDMTMQPTVSSAGSYYGLTGQSRSSMMMSSIPIQWPSTPVLSSTPISYPNLQSRPSSGNSGSLHSPLTAQVYTADTGLSLQMRNHSVQSLDVSDSAYALQQHSPDQMLPECASTEPVNTSLTDYKGTTATLQN